MPLPPDTLTVQTREQAKLLLDETYTRVLECAMQNHVSASDTAKKAVMPLKQVHHRLTKLLPTGLVKVTDEKQMNGRAIRIYAATAYRILVELTEVADVEDAMRRTTVPHWDAFCKASAQLFKDEQRMEFQFLMDNTGHLSQNLNPARMMQESVKDTYGALFSSAAPVLITIGIVSAGQEQ